MQEERNEQNCQREHKGRERQEGHNVFGYARVSTREQNVDRQRIALTGVGIPQEKIYVDRQSGKDFDRPQYVRMLRELKQGSVLYVKSIDRLGRNYSDLTEQWRLITKQKGADIVVLALLSYVAENERANVADENSGGSSEEA